MSQSLKPPPLQGLRVLELAAIGPVPHLGTILGNLGAEVTVLSRLAPGRYDFLHSFYAQRKQHLAVDLKSKEGIAKVLELLPTADVLIEGLRPGVMERLGLAPEVCLEKNSKLIYARVTGYGQEGPLATQPGHDINYIAHSGALHAFRRGAEKPVPPLNLVADFAGGSMHGAISILAALHGLQAGLPVEQVLDIAMVDGSAALLTMSHNFAAVLDSETLDPLGNAPFYAVYESADEGEYIAVGAVEPEFFSHLLLVTGIDFPDDGSQQDQSRWPELEEKLAAAFRTKSRAEWARIGAETDSCISAVLTLEESVSDPQMKTRIDGQRLHGAVGGALHPSLYAE